MRRYMIIIAHVCGRRPQPRLTTRHPAAGELPRGRQDQEPNPRQPVALARRAPQGRRDLALALIVARLLEPAAKLATARMLDPATASHSLGEMLGLGKVAAKEVYAALDWLGREQPFIEATLARRHLQDGALLLYDVHLHLSRRTL